MDHHRAFGVGTVHTNERQHRTAVAAAGNRKHAGRFVHDDDSAVLMDNLQPAVVVSCQRIWVAG